MNKHFPVNTVLIQRGALAAQQDGRLDEFIKAGLDCMWEENLNMGNPEVFAASMAAKGFDGADIFARTQDPNIKTKLIENTEMAVKRGAFGVPTFYVGDEMFFGKDRLNQVEEEVVK